MEKPKLRTVQNPDGTMNITMNTTQGSANSTKKRWKFEDYLKKFEPATIWEQIDKQKKYNGLIITDKEQSEMMIRAMDPTDELMALKIENGHPQAVFDQNGRRQGWKPGRLYPGFRIDPLQVRNRMHELMKQAIYMTRNKMVIMQTFRTKYRNFSLFKMGVLFNKADNAAKTFGKFSFRAYRACLLAREKILFRVDSYNIMAANERQLHLWFNVEILADLIHDNDVIAREVIRNHTVNRSAAFDKVFID